MAHLGLFWTLTHITHRSISRIVAPECITERQIIQILSERLLVPLYIAGIERLINEKIQDIVIYYIYQLTRRLIDTYTLLDSFWMVQCQMAWTGRNRGMCNPHMKVGISRGFTDDIFSIYIRYIKVVSTAI